ncbi:MAG: hypothetical protein IKL95_02915 [Alphaproteobacteria bacterium]|nr:hypothetical protein [Alphaproteobacteria bacterium]
MKKLALSSLVAVFAVSAANAGVIDGNPLYMPKAGHFYSVSDLSSHSGSEGIKAWTLNEEFGYGISDRFTVAVSTDVENQTFFNEWGWGETSLAATYRALDRGAWKADLIGKYEIDPVWGNHSPILDKDVTEYTWTAGVRGGYTTSKFTVAAKALFDYTNTESFNWDEDAGKQGEHYLTLGVDGQVALCDRLNLVAGVDYVARLDSKDHGSKLPADKIKNAGKWNGTLGLNYNIDPTKYVGAYMTASMDHRGGKNADEWDVKNGFGFGAKFGIDF